VLLDDDGGVERLAAEGVDGCTRDSVVRPDVLGPLVARLRQLGRPLGPEDVDDVLGARLAALAPRGVLAAPVGAEVSGVLLLMEPADDALLDGEALAGVAVLATLAGAALENARRLVALGESRDELQALAGRVLTVRDHERREIAHRVHEGVCQRLAAANAQLQALEPLLDEQAVAARERLRDARVLVNRTLGELRDLAQELRPSVLDDFGYVHALRWYLSRLRERAGVSLSLEVEGTETRLPVAVEGALYRATEEVLGAVAERRRRGRLRVRFAEDAAVLVEITGGVPEAAIDLPAMRECLRPYGGAVRVTSRPGASTVIEVNVPAPAVN
jgi:signal transduction histidine kinase